MDTIIAEIRLKRGIKANLPTEAPLGEPMWMEDTGELYIGQGEGKAPKLINENVSSLRQAIQTLENNKANKVHTHTVEEIGGLNDTLTALRAEDVRLDEKIDQRIEEAIGEGSSSGNSYNYTKEYTKSGYIRFEVETDKSLYDYPPIKVYKKNKQYEYDYDNSIWYDDNTLSNEDLYIGGNIYDSIVPSEELLALAVAHPSQVAGGGYPRGNPYSPLIYLGDVSSRYINPDFSFSVSVDYNGVAIRRDTAHESLDFWRDDIYGDIWDSENYSYNIEKSFISGSISQISNYVDLDNFYIDIIHSEDYIVPDNLVVIFSYGLYNIESTLYEPKCAFLELNSDDEFDIVVYDTQPNARELITDEFINRFGVKATDLGFIRNNRNGYIGSDKIAKVLKELAKMEGFSYDDLLISFTTNNETVLPIEVAIEDWQTNLHNSYYTTKQTSTDFKYLPLTSRQVEMYSYGDIGYPGNPNSDDVGDYIPISILNLMNPEIIEDRDVRYELGMSLPQGSVAIASLYLGHESREEIAYDWNNDKFKMAEKNSYSYYDSNTIPLDLLNNLSIEQWNGLFDLILEHSKLTQCPTALNVDMKIYPSKSYLEKIEPITFYGLIISREDEWYEEDKNPLNASIIYEDEETGEKSLELSYGYTAINNYKNRGAIEGTIVQEEYMIQVPFEKYTKYDYTTSEIRVEIRTAQEFIDALNDIYWGTYLDIKNDLDFLYINLNESLNHIYARNITINGNGYAFKNIRTNGRPFTDEMRNGVIRDLVIENLYTDINSQNDNHEFGIFSGSAHDTVIENVVVKNSTINVKDENRYGINGISFLFGECFSSKIKNCHIYDSHITSLNIFAEYSSSGGFAGYGGLVEIEKCSYVGGSIRINNYTGGIIGNAFNTKILDCYVNTNFILNDYDTSVDDEYYGSYPISEMGGIVGYVDSNIHLENCYNYSTFNDGCPLNHLVLESVSFGSLIGHIDDYSSRMYLSKIKNCYYGGTGWYSYDTEKIKHYNEESGIVEPEDSYRYKNFKLVGNKDSVRVGYDGDTGLINVIYENCSFLPLNRDQMGDTELIKFDFENTWKISEEGLPILKVQENHLLPSTPIRDLKVVQYPEKHQLINNYNVFEVEIDVAVVNNRRRVTAPYISGTYSGLFFSSRKLSDLKATVDETGEALQTLSFSKPHQYSRVQLDTPKASSLTKLSDFNTVWTKANVYTGIHYYYSSGYDFGEMIAKCVSEFGKQDGDKIYMYITSGMPTDYTSSANNSNFDFIKESYRSAILQIGTKEEEKIDYGKSDTKNVLIISSYDDSKFTMEAFELISTLTWNGKITTTLRNPDLYFLKIEEIKEYYDLVIISKVNPDEYEMYELESLTNELLNYGIPVINTSSQMAEYTYEARISIRQNRQTGSTLDVGTNIFGTSEIYNMYDSQSYMSILNATHPITSSLGVTDNSQLQLMDTEVYNETGIVFSSINQELSEGQVLVKDTNGNTLLAVIPKGTNGSNADYIVYKLLDAPYGILTEYGRDIAKNVINNALRTNSTTRDEIYVYEGDVEFFGEEYLYNDGYMSSQNHYSGGGYG